MLQLRIMAVTLQMQTQSMLVHWCWEALTDNYVGLVQGKLREDIYYDGKDAEIYTADTEWWRLISSGMVTTDMVTWTHSRDFTLHLLVWNCISMCGTFRLSECSRKLNRFIMSADIRCRCTNPSDRAVRCVSECATTVDPSFTTSASPGPRLSTVTNSRHPTTSITCAWTARAKPMLETETGTASTTRNLVPECRRPCYSLRHHPPRVATSDIQVSTSTWIRPSGARCDAAPTRCLRPGKRTWRKCGCQFGPASASSPPCSPFSRSSLTRAASATRNALLSPYRCANARAPAPTACDWRPDGAASPATRLLAPSSATVSATRTVRSYSCWSTTSVWRRPSGGWYWHWRGSWPRDCAGATRR